MLNKDALDIHEEAVIDSDNPKTNESKEQDLAVIDEGVTYFNNLNEEESKLWRSKARKSFLQSHEFQELSGKLSAYVDKQGERNLVCTVCKKRFDHKTKAIEHVGIHVSAFKWTCDCGRIFDKLTTLRTHYPCQDVLKKFILSVYSSYSNV